MSDSVAGVLNKAKAFLIVRKDLTAQRSATKELVTGMLEKKSRKNKFQNRYFKLIEDNDPKQDCLQYFANEASLKEPKGAILLSTIQMVNVHSGTDLDNRIFEVVFTGPCKKTQNQGTHVLVLRAFNVSSREDWVTKLQQACLKNRFNTGGDSWARRIEPLSDETLVQFAEGVVKLASEVQKGKEEVARLENAREENEEEMISIRSEIEQRRKQVDELHAEVDRLTQQLEETQQDLDLEREREPVQVPVVDDGLNEQIEELQARLKEKDEELVIQCTRNFELMTISEASNAEAAKQLREAEAERARRVAIEEQLSSLEDQQTSLTEALARVQKELRAMKEAERIRLIESQRSPMLEMLGFTKEIVDETETSPTPSQMETAPPTWETSAGAAETNETADYSDDELYAETDKEEVDKQPRKMCGIWDI